MWWVTVQKNGANALELQQVLGVGQYKTAWIWLRQLRCAMGRPGRDDLNGIVEVDETQMGGKALGAVGMTLVFQRATCFNHVGERSSRRVEMLGGIEGRQPTNSRTALPFRTPKFVEPLEIEPKFARGAEEVPQAKGRVTSDRAPTVENLGDAVNRHFDPPSQLRRAHAERVEILAQRLARMDGFAHYDSSPSMAVHDFHVRRAGASLRPLETDLPLVIDADTPLPLAPALEASRRLPGRAGSPKPVAASS